MRSLSVIILMLVSSSAVGQAFNCGMFGMLKDDRGYQYIGRFNDQMDYVRLESLATCEVIVADIEVFDIRNGKRTTVIWMNIDNEFFDDLGYKVKYPTGSWNLIRSKNDTEDNPWWPIKQ